MSGTVRFEIGGHQYVSEEILDQWYGPDDTFFKLRADDGNLYIIKRNGAGELASWSLESFRRADPALTL